MGPGKAKDWDGSNVLGPCIVTADEFDATDARMRVRVNGELWGEDTSAHMHHTFADMIAYASRSQTLRAGRGASGRGRPPAARASSSAAGSQQGDVVELEVEGIGVLRNHIGRKRSMTMAYVVSAKWRAKEGKDERLLEVIREMTPPSRAEPGNRLLPGAALDRGPAALLPLRAVRRRGGLRGPHGLRALHPPRQGARRSRSCSRTASARSTRRSTTTRAGSAVREARQRVHGPRARSTRPSRCCSTSSASRRACPAPSLDGGDGETFTGAMTIKLGPVTSRYRGHGPDRARPTRPRTAPCCAPRRSDARGSGHRGGDDHHRHARGRRTARAWPSRPTCASAGRRRSSVAA